ncbi:hypothetical protein SEEC0006_26648 [Salmonella enterica subsp. enterica serovar Choleraesuis str. 0006]|nr:hypothetical protein SEEC0006_26648 [Salmonella enterica subsp. enterica serovar Choleraesuis str. 0006]
MMKTSVRIGAFEIDDAELHGESPGERTLTIPCKSDPDLCMQLDAWDAETSVPAILNGDIPFCSVIITILNLMPGSCVLPDSKEPVARRVIYFFLSHSPRANLSYTIV